MSGFCPPTSSSPPLNLASAASPAALVKAGSTAFKFSLVFLINFSSAVCTPGGATGSFLPFLIASRRLKFLSSASRAAALMI